jgi:uncharacterized protein (UPF0332 family)
MSMDFESLVRDHRIKRVTPDQRQISKQLDRAEKDLQAAAHVCPIDRTWCFTIAYQAMIRAGRAFMFSQGYLPTSTSSHLTVIDFIRDAFGFRTANLLLRFERMRRKRHDFLYDSVDHTTEQEAFEAIQTAQELIRTIRDIT